MRDDRLTLPDGRRLAFTEYGAADGSPMLYCHGYPGSRHEPAFADGTATRIGVRLITADRPGMGGSDYQPGRDLLDWPDDVRVLANHLDIERFAVVGVSGGAPYALACAFALPGMVRSAAIVSGVGPPAAVRASSAGTTSGLGLRLVGWIPRMASLLSPLVGAFARGGSALLFRLMAAHAPVADRRILGDPAFRAMLGTSLGTAFEQGSRGATADLRLLSAPWPFPVDHIRTPVDLWHGEDDRVVPVSMGHYLAHALPDCRATVLPDEGHYSLIGRHVDRIMLDLLERRPGRDGDPGEAP